ncbi:MAG: glycosyltransferase [Rhizonema sp. PD37]|nr:glycosyltransferase [Rhizonema sp. PD37]
MWLIYALGGGWGHITRALSLGRIAAKQREVHIITNSPYAKRLGDEGCSLHCIPSDANFATTCSQVLDILLNTDYDCLIVDTFPRGLGGELANILPQLQHIRKIFIHRDINPYYVEVKGLRSFVSKNFDAVIVPGEKELPLSDLANVRHTAPWLIRNAWELTDKVTIKSRILQVDESLLTILVCAAGEASELSLFGQLALQLHLAFPQCAVRILSADSPVECPQQWVSHHPGIECLAAADIVVGGAGYNTVYECAAVGVPLVTLPLPRMYDRQDKRASQGYRVQNIESAIATVRMLLNQVQPEKNSSMRSYINGSIQAMHYIIAHEQGQFL